MKVSLSELSISNKKNIEKIRIIILSIPIDIESSLVILKERVDIIINMPKQIESERRIILLFAF